MKRMIFALLLVSAICGAVSETPGALPPFWVNYQGVLRDAAGNPVDDTLEMTFRLYDAAGTGCPPSGGTLLYEEYHLAGNPQAVTVTGGLFNVALGSGDPSAFPVDDLGQVFRFHTLVYIEVEVAGEVLCPRMLVLSAPHALNALNTTLLDNKPASGFLDTSASSQTKTGSLTLNGDLSVGGGDLTIGGTTLEVGPTSTILTAGTGHSLRLIGGDDLTDGGLSISGDDQSVHLYSGSGNIEFFSGDTGLLGAIRPSGDHLVVGNLLFADVGGASISDIGPNLRIANGFDISTLELWGGNDANDGAISIHANGAIDLRSGNGLFTFRDTNRGEDTATIGSGDYGIQARGAFPAAGGYFEDSTFDGVAEVGIGQTGIRAVGSFQGGEFDDLNSSAFARVGHDTYKILGTGAVSFIQNHPHDPDKSIVYAAPEGDEVAVYTRGSARLTNGEVRVELGETFAWVANPDIGLTVQLTPRGPDALLWVESISTSELVVRGAPGSDTSFDYLVHGLRIGFEELAIVQEKDREAYIPSMAEHRRTFERRPELRRFNALERFRGMDASARPVDLSRAAALRATIQEYDPALHRPYDAAASRLLGGDGVPQTGTAQERPPRELADVGPQIAAPDAAVLSGPSGADGESRSVTFVHPQLPVAEPVEAGDVVVADEEAGAALRPGSEAFDPRSVGIAVGPSSEGLVPVATFGVISCKVDAGYGSVRVGDLLTSSPTPGHAMRADDPRPGTIVGKALESLDSGTGTLRVLIMLR